MSRRDEIRMTEQEVADFLAERFRGQFATIGRDGSPHLVPISYTLLDGNIAFWADSDSQKTVNIGRDPRVTVLVEDGVDMQELQGVMVKGRAELRTDDETVERIADGYLARYPGEVPEAVREGTIALGKLRTTVVVIPEKVVSWDHRKLGGEARAADLGT